MRIIEKLFYPRELKETIFDLRKKGDLNEEALGRLHGFLTQMLFVWGFICFLFSFVFLDPNAKIFHAIIIKAADNFFKSKKYKKGDPVVICYNSEYPDSNVPFIASMAKLYYLRKTPPDLTAI